MNNLDVSKRPHHEVVIVGLGPTGATLANILAGYGLDVLVLEREESVYPLPRAVHFDDEAMRVFQSIGLAEGIGRDARDNVGTKFVDRDQKLLLDLEYIVDQLSDFYNPQEARLWLFSRQRLLDGKTPAELIRAGRTEDIIRIIDQLRDSVFV